MIFFCPKQGQAHSWAHPYPNIGRVPPTPRDFRIRLGSASVSMEKSRLLQTLIHRLTFLSRATPVRFSNFFRPFVQSAHYLKKNTSVQRVFLQRGCTFRFAKALISPTCRVIERHVCPEARVGSSCQRQRALQFDFS